MNEKNIYILFTDTGTIFTKLIKMYTKKSYNHVSIAFDEQLQDIFSFGRKKHYNPFIGGFVREEVSIGLFKKAACKIYRITVSEIEHQQMLNKVKQIEAEKEAYRYNFLGLIAILVNFDLKRNNAFFCSQFVATILNEKVKVLNKTPSLVTPQDIMNLTDLQFVYQGELTLYPKYTKAKSIENNLELNRRNRVLCS